MISKAKVSIIIPVYNIKKYIDKCVESVCKQTYENIEIIIVDDGSTDGSEWVCDLWKTKDDRIKVIHKENGGLSSARNEGLKHATGKYILFVDGDDSIDDDLLEKTIPHMDNGCEMVAFGYRLTYEHEKEQEIKFPMKEHLLNTDMERQRFLIGPFFKYEFGWNAWNRIFLKEYIDNYEIKFVDTKDIFAEDLLFCLCYLVHCKNIKMLDVCLYNYMQREGSIMNRSEKEKDYHFAQLNNLSREFLDYCNKWEDCKYVLTNYSVVHYLIMERAIQRLERDKLKVNEVRKIIRDSIVENKSFEYFEKWMKLFKKESKILELEYSFSNILRKKCRVKGILSKNSIMYKFLLLIYRFCGV